MVNILTKLSLKGRIVFIRRKDPIPAKLTHIYSDTFWGVGEDGLIRFRGMKIQPRMLHVLKRCQLARPVISSMVKVHASFAG